MKISFLKHPSIHALLFVVVVCFSSCSSSDINHSFLNYDLLLSNEGLAIVHLKEPNTKQIDTTQLNIIADSLYQNRPALRPENIELSYIVRFYYREDWKGHMCYAIKTWDYHYDEKAFFPSKLDVTGTTGDEKQDEINYNKNVKVIRTSFDTTAYLKKIKNLSRKKIKDLVKAQVGEETSVKSFVELCKQKLDSAKIITDGNDNYTYLYHNHLINVWGNVSYPVTKNDFNYSKIVTFEGCYDLFGNQVYFKSSF